MGSGIFPLYIGKDKEADKIKEFINFINSEFLEDDEYRYEGAGDGQIDNALSDGECFGYLEMAVHCLEKVISDYYVRKDK